MPRKSPTKPTSPLRNSPHSPPLEIPVLHIAPEKVPQNQQVLMILSDR